MEKERRIESKEIGERCEKEIIKKSLNEGG